MLCRPVIIGFLLLALLLWLPLSTHAAPDKLDTLERALALVENGDVEAARTSLASVDNAAAPDAFLLASRAVISLYLGQYADAESGCRQAIAGNPQELTALWGLALCSLRTGRYTEAKSVLDRAVLLAPSNPHLRTLQAYACLSLGLVDEAALAGKIALDNGETSAFLYAVMGQVQHRLGFPNKAVEYGKTAAKAYASMDFLAHDSRLALSLTPATAEHPASAPATATDTHDPFNQRTPMEVDPAKANTKPGDGQPTFHIVAPQPGSTVHGLQTVQVSYTGAREVKYMVLLVDHALRGMITDVPYQFHWDSATVAPGEHQLIARAYDYRDTLIDESAATISTAVLPASFAQNSSRQAALERHMMTMTMPAPTPISLFNQLGRWYHDAGDLSQAIAAYEKAAAIDPTRDSVLDNLAQLYTANGLHPFSHTGVIYRGPALGLKQVALTFDDGPNPMYTPTILAELQRYGAHGTFFVVGRMAQQYPELVQDILAQGHEVGNHSYTHPNLTHLQPSEVIAEVLRNRTVIKDITGRQTYLFRPPGGQIDAEVTQQLRALDYNIIYWDINAGEFRKNAPVDQANKILNKVTDGSIILLHNGPVDGTMNILTLLLNGLTDRGFRCVTVSELMNER